MAELLARVEVVLRRFHKTAETIRVGEHVTVDLRQHIVISYGEEIALTPKEYDVHYEPGIYMDDTRGDCRRFFKNN